MSSPLVIRAAARREAELAWVCEVIFGRWLGLAYRIEPNAQGTPEVEVVAARGSVVWPDTFLANADAHWLQLESLPAVPLPSWPIPEEVRDRVGQSSAAQFFGDGRFEEGTARIRLPIDITGSIFFMLSRYEEAVAGAATDRHGRSPGSASLAHRAGWALRPLVDEWVELLWWAIQRVAPGLRRRARAPKVWVSCDVDAPYSPGAKGIGWALRQTASDLVNHRSPAQAGRTLLNAAASRVGVTRFDPFDTFDWMMDVNERAGHRVTFFFINVDRPLKIDGCYELGEPRVSRLLERLVARGHDIGLHGSYASVDSADRLAGELEGLRSAVRRAGGSQDAFGSRQHYLRWRPRETARMLDGLPLAYDSTLAFADVAGFRCGTCHDFPLFELVGGRALALVERPLVLMEATVISRAYLGLGFGEAARDLMMGLRESCRRFGGEFSLLWHNSNLVHPAARELYAELLQPW
ncbi:polysaccharide deacetylase family protein [Ideonella sp. DXS29W]|uniref:Polysaccharide deacetylase family protein n=1 Tax=Ideonella lacteola TaxID=2984193 RepID=A0ABU9BQW0_9BURK